MLSVRREQIRWFGPMLVGVKNQGGGCAWIAIEDLDIHQAGGNLWQAAE